MKPLLSQKITRRRKRIGDYISAEEQATLDGLTDFATRQRKRLEAAQGKPAPLPENVSKLPTKRRA